MEARRLTWGWVAGLLVLSLVIGGVAGGVAGVATARLFSEDEEEKVVSLATPSGDVSAVTLSEESAITEAVEIALPSVVAILNEEVTPTGTGDHLQSLGSGVIIDEGGYIVTNEHVVRDAAHLTVVLHDGEEREATLVGQDWPFTDLAVLKIAEGGLTAVHLGDYEALVLGQRVIAVGHPLSDIESTVTVGVVSGLERSWQRNGIVMEDLIQTDAAVNPGNSGGALINTLGQLVGIPTTVVRSDAGREVEGVAFAISSKTVEEVAGEILTQGVVTRAFLGVSHIDLTPEIAAARGMDVERGAWISSVGSGTPADRAGMEVGDVVLRMGEHDITTDTPFLNVLKLLKPDETVPVLIEREGEQLTLSVTLVQREPR